MQPSTCVHPWVAWQRGDDAPESGGFFPGARGRLLSSGMLSASFRSPSAGMTGVVAIVRMLQRGNDARRWCHQPWDRSQARASLSRPARRCCGENRCEWAGLAPSGEHAWRDCVHNLGNKCEPVDLRGDGRGERSSRDHTLGHCRDLATCEVGDCGGAAGHAPSSEVVSRSAERSDHRKSGCTAEKTRDRNEALRAAFTRPACAQFRPTSPVRTSLWAHVSI